MQEIIINSSNEGQKLKKICFRILKEAPQSFTYKMLRKKNITLNGKKATGEEVLKNGDSIKFFLSDETFSKFSPDYQMASNQPGSDNRQSANVMNQRDSENRGYFGDQVSSEDYSLSDSLDILYEDKDIAILNKSYGILSQKAGVDDISINELFVEYLIKNPIILQDLILISSLLIFKNEIINSTKGEFIILLLISFCRIIDSK